MSVVLKIASAFSTITPDPGQNQKMWILSLSDGFDDYSYDKCDFYIFSRSGTTFFYTFPLDKTSVHYS